MRTIITVLIAVAAFTFILAPPAVFGGGREFSQAEVTTDLNAETIAAINNGLEYLKKTRNSNGSFGGNYPVASTALAGLAFLSTGSGYLRGPYGEEVEAAAKYLIDEAADSWGYFNDGDQSRLHGHGYASTFLTEVYGQFPPVLREKAERVIKKAVQIILSSQTEYGGWGYYPRHSMNWGANFDEASVTVTMAQALRSARNAGFYVPKEKIDLAIDYVKKCATKNGFRYTLQRGGNTTYALTAAAVSVLNATGVYESDELEMGLNFMRRQMAAYDYPTKAAMFFYYGNLYAAQAMWQSSQKDWELWYKKGYRDILNRQTSDGSWGGDSYGPTFSTAIGILILAVPYQYLPIFQK
jgi:hypothetical protein